MTLATNLASYIHALAARLRGGTGRAGYLPSLCIPLLLPMLVSGCALLSEGDVRLVYPPNPAPKESAVTGLADSGMVDIVILPFDDIRADTARVGELEDLSTGRFTRLATEASVREWMAGAIRYELARAGFHAVQGSGAQSPGVTVIAGDVDVVQNSGAFRQGAEVAFIARVMRNGDTLLHQRYVGQGSAASGSRMNTRLYGRSLSIALAEAVAAFVSDVREAVEEK